MPDDPLIGFQTDTLAFTALLGKGAMGAVYKGTQLALSRPVAIKVIAPHLANDDAYRERFSREAQTLGRLIHINVIACHDVGPITGPDGAQLFVMVLEFVDGWSLGHLLKREKQLTVRQVLELHRQAAEGLAAAHQLGIVHRDIKPDNIMVTRNGQAKLADFGLAKADDSAMLTQTGAILGSPSYMSPEACRGEQPTSSSDLYSLGCSLFHCLTGTTPYSATSTLQALQLHVNAPVPVLSSRRPDLAVLDGLLTRCLAKKPEDRHADAGALAKAIRGAIALVAPEVTAGGGVLPVSASVAASPTLVSGQQATASMPTAAPAATVLTQVMPPPSAWRRGPLKWTVIGVGALALVAIGAALAHPKPGATIQTQASATKPPPGDDAGRLASQLDAIDRLIAAGDLDGAGTLLAQLDVPTGQRFNPLNERLAAIRSRLAAAIAAKPAVSDQQSLKQDMETSLAAIAADIADGHADRLDKAAAALSALVVSDDLKERKRQLGESLEAAWKSIAQRYAGELDTAEKDLAAGRAGAARETLRGMQGRALDHFPDLAQRHDELKRKMLALRNAGDAQPAAPAATGAPLKATFTVLRSDAVDDKPKAVIGWPAREGFPDLPPKQPAGGTSLIGSIPAENARSVIRLVLPAGQHLGHDGVAVMVCDGVFPGRELRVERVSGGTVTAGPTFKLSGRDWEALSIPLADATQPVTELRLSVPVGTEKLWLAKAVFGSGAVPGVADLQVDPGTLLAMSYREPMLMRRGLYRDLVTVCRAQPEFLDVKKMRLAVPFLGLTKGRADCVRLLHHLADSLARAEGGEKAAAIDERTQLVSYTDAALKNLFDQNADAKPHLLFVLLPTDAAPRPSFVDLGKLCGDVVDKGTLPVLVLTASGGVSPDRDAWERFIQQLRKEQPGLPIIDLGEVPLFMRQHHLPMPGGEAPADAVYDGLEAGVRELLQRVRFALDTGGARREASALPAAGETPAHRPLRPR